MYRSRWFGANSTAVRLAAGALVLLRGHDAASWQPVSTMPPVYRVRISPADVGSRVSVRVRRPPSSAGPSTTDVVGWLRRWDGGVLTIERRDGATVAVAATDLVAGKTVPPPVQRRGR